MPVWGGYQRTCDRFPPTARDCNTLRLRHPIARDCNTLRLRHPIAPDCNTLRLRHPIARDCNTLRLWQLDFLPNLKLHILVGQVVYLHQFIHSRIVSGGNRPQGVTARNGVLASTGRCRCGDGHARVCRRDGAEWSWGTGGRGRRDHRACGCCTGGCLARRWRACWRGWA